MYEYFKLLQKILNKGVLIEARNLIFFELINETITIHPHANFYSCTSRPLEITSKYLLGELPWYLSGNRYVNGINKYSKFWNQIANKDETVNSNYGWLVFYRKKYEYTNYEWCLKCLKEDINTRQAVMQYNSKEFYYEGNKDFICTQMQQFFIRQHKLISIVYIRSSDAIKGLTYDIPWWSLVQQKLVLDLQQFYPDLILGDLIVHIGSAHFYQKDYYLVKKMCYYDQERYFHKVHLVNNFILGKDQVYYESKIKNIVLIR